MKKLLCVVLILLLLCGCSGVPAIEQMPYPEAEKTGLRMSMDYSTTDSLQDMWNRADWVVVGYYKNEPPQSVNINRKLDDFSVANDAYYLETLVYHFEVVEVLKGDMQTGTIPLGLFHGEKELEVSYPFETFQQPDIASYKVMFLWHNDICGYYYPWARDWWLSTEHTLERPAKTNWMTLTFGIEDTTGWGHVRVLDLLDSNAQSIYQAEAEPDSTRHVRTSYTGAELLEIANQETK